MQKLHSFLFFFVVFASICSSKDVELILHGRIVKDSVSYTPLGNTRVGAASGILASAFGSDTTDSLGNFFIPITAAEGIHIPYNSSLYLTHSGTNYQMPVNKSGSLIIIYSDNKTLRFANHGISKGDTIIVGTGQKVSHTIFDAVFGKSNPHQSDYADELLLPKWVTMDECTGWVCIRISAPETSKIAECKLKKNIGNDLDYTFNFFIKVQPDVGIMYDNEKSKRMVSYDIPLLITNQHILIRLQAEKTQKGSAELVTLDGKKISQTQFLLLVGENRVCFNKPETPGIYILEISTKNESSVIPVYLQNLR